jgi:hypothetical protein
MNEMHQPLSQKLSNSELTMSTEAHHSRCCTTAPQFRRLLPRTLSGFERQTSALDHSDGHRGVIAQSPIVF